MNPKTFMCHLVALTVLPTALIAAKNAGGNGPHTAAKNGLALEADLPKNHPSTKLKNLMDVYLDAILSPLTTPSPKLPSTEVAALRAALSTSLSSTQTPAAQQVVKNAVVFCDYMSKCMDDRAESLAKMKAMAKTNVDSGATDLHINLKSGGVDAGAKARAKLNQETKERKDLKQEAKQEQNSFVANFQRTWVTSATNMRKHLCGLHPPTPTRGTS